MPGRNILRIGLCIATLNPVALRAADPAAAVAESPAPPHAPGSAGRSATAVSGPPVIPSDILDRLPRGCLQAWSASDVAAVKGPPSYLHANGQPIPQDIGQPAGPPAYLAGAASTAVRTDAASSQPPAYLPLPSAAAKAPAVPHAAPFASQKVLPQRLPNTRAALHREQLLTIQPASVSPSASAPAATPDDAEALAADAPPQPLAPPIVNGGDPTPATRTDALLDGGDSLLDGGDALLDGGDSLLEGGDALLDVDPLMQAGPPTATEELKTPGGAVVAPPTDDPHHALLLENAYPSAQSCAQCHPRQYDEWRASGHAYAVVSPMFQRFEQTVTDLSEGTVGYFCIRCHAPVATQLELPRSLSVLDAPPMLREGITCIACHRINEAYGRTNGMRRIEPGDIHQPVYGPIGGSGVAEAVSQRDQLKLKTDPRDTGPGQPIHTEGRCFEPISRSDFCASCHQVAVHPGIALEVVHAQYRSGPAAAQGITCQDCHMGSEPGKPHGYGYGPVAELAGKPWGKSRKQSNHTFWGPGYSIAHPGIFPHNKQADRWTARQWVTFDYRAGWGTEAFEQAVPPDCVFPPPWDNSDERRDARRILEANLQRDAQKHASAIAVMQAGARIEGPLFDAPPRPGLPLRFRYRVANTSDGHNLPTGSLGAQPQMWLNVALVGPDGRRLWESGYLDGGGDLADLHSRDVALGLVRRDAQLFNLQTKFLINNVKGTDREASLPLNFSQDQLVFLRPGAVPVSVLNHPPLIRMEARSIPPRGSREAVYQVPAEAISVPGVYRLSVRLRSRPEPIHFMRQVGSSPEMIRRMNERILNIHPQSHAFLVR